MIKKVIITGDILRIRIEKGEAYTFHDKRINKYYNFFKYQIAEATNLRVEKINIDNTDFSAKKMYEMCNIEYKSDQEWLQIYDLKKIPKTAVEYYGKYIKNSLVVYIEMPMIFKTIHNILNIPYIDLTVHPIRFLDDHLFGFSTNDTKIFEQLKKYQIDEMQFYIHANMIKSTVDFAPLQIQENSVLIAGQTNVDKALYHEGRCLTIMDFQDEIEEMGKKYDIVYYKAHPFNSDLRKIHDFLKKFPFVRLCPSDWNVYKILANPNLKKVYAITSGVLYEAKYFNKESEAFFEPYLKFSYDKNCEYDEHTYLSIYNEFINPIFWADILRDKVKVNEECKNIILNDRPNRLRAVFNDYWSYTELDPSVITATKKYETRIRTLECRISENRNINYIQDNTIIEELRQRVNFLESVLGGMRNDPIFEKNFLKRMIKRSVFGLSNKSTNINARVVLAKLKQEAKQFVERGEVITEIKAITYRPHAPNGGRGGGGAVLSAMQQVIGVELERYKIAYNYSEPDGIWHTLKNRYFTYKNYERLINKESNLIPLYAAIAFVLEKTKYERGKIYVCHEYATAYGLALLNKKYILILHSQGPRAEEKVNLGEKLSPLEIKVIQKCEEFAMKKALYVCFPSKGAEKAFFESKYTKVAPEGINLGPTLYNTLYVDLPAMKMSNIKKEKTILTFLSVGTMTNAKGQDKVCRFFERLLKSGYSKKIRWICVGKGPMEDEVYELANKLAETYINFEFIGLRKLHFREVQYLHSISDIYIMLHRIAIFDLATLEAMKNKCALILSEIGGNIEFNVSDNVLFVDEEKEEVKKMVESIDLEEYKERSIKAYEEMFSKECFKERYLELILRSIKECNNKKEI